MKRRATVLSLMALLSACGIAAAQTPGVLYTFAAPDASNYNWLAVGPQQTASLSISGGALTVTETGYFDPFNEIEAHGGSLLISDGYNRLRESATFEGGLDLTGLSFLEIDVSHTGTGPINVQPYTQVGPNSTYISWGQNDLAMQPDVTYTLQFPLSVLNAEQRAYVRTVGFQTRNHESLGDVSWTISEVRSVGTPLTIRDLATHNVGSSDNGFNGVVGNFDLGAIVGNDGGQNQSGLSINPAGSGSLQWTDKGGDGTQAQPSGAAISWANGTGWGGSYLNNTFFERPADVSNYNRLLYRMKATDVNAGGGGSIGVQAFFQNGAYTYMVAGTPLLPVDGEYHDLILPLNTISQRQYVQAFGVNLSAHPNDVIIDVDLVQFQTVTTIPGDYNSNGVVDAADYVVWRKASTLPFFLLDNEVAGTTPGTVTIEDYNAWRARFGNAVAGSGSVGGSGSVPEPSAVGLSLLGLAAGIIVRRRQF